MGRRVLTWSLTLPLVGASVLGGHALAYAATGRAQGPAHAYLAHAPQLLALLVLVGLVGLAVDQRSERPCAAPFAALGLLVFTLQEHAERVVHTGDLPFLLLDRTFLLGLVLQVPVGLAALAIARLLVTTLRGALRRPARPPLLATLPGPVWAVVALLARAPRTRATLSRGPPVLLRS